MKSKLQNMTLPEKQLEKEVTSNTIAKLALIISIVTAVFTLTFFVLPYYSKSILMSPSGFGIIRGFEPFPSDIIMIPLEWKVHGQRDMLINQPKLILENLKTKEVLEFCIKGEIFQISKDAIHNTFVYGSSFALRGNSLNKKFLMFQIHNFWDDRESNENYEFRFESGQEYKVILQYQINQRKTIEEELFIMPIYDTVNNMQLQGESPIDYWWDYFDLDIPKK